MGTMPRWGAGGDRPNGTVPGLRRFQFVNGAIDRRWRMDGLLIDSGKATLQRLRGLNRFPCRVPASSRD